jgi:transcriptional regulator with XRE-family HTH domain
MNLSETKIKSLRTKAGISQEELSALTGLSLRTIQRIENGETIARGDSLQRIAKALNVQVEALTIEATSEMQNPALREDQKLLVFLMLSPLSYFIFPLLGIMLPAIIWFIYKDSVREVREVGSKVLQLQFLWLVIFSLVSVYIVTRKLFHQGFPAGVNAIWIIVALYISNACIILGYLVIRLRHLKGRENHALS